MRTTCNNGGFKLIRRADPTSATDDFERWCNVETVGGIVALVGIAIFFLGHFWLVFIIGRKNLSAGVVSFVIFITSFYFIRNRWSESKYAVYVLGLGVLIFVIGGMIANYPVDT